MNLALWEVLLLASVLPAAALLLAHLQERSQ